MWRGQRQSTTGKGQAIRHELRSERRHEMIGAGHSTRFVDQPSENGGQSHARDHAAVTGCCQRWIVTDFLHESMISLGMAGRLADPGRGATRPRRLPMTEPMVIQREVQVAAPPATVFAFLTDPEKILRWMGTEATLDPNPGGLYLLNVGGKHIARGEFTEVIPVHRLAYSFGWEGREEMRPGSSLIEIDPVEKDGGTLVRFTHSWLPDEKERASREKGWNQYQPKLAVAAAGRTPGADTPDEEA